MGYVAGPRASVSIDEGRAYSLGTMGHLFCFDAAEGSVLWKHDLNTEYQIRMPKWGIAASPLVVDDLVVVQIGGQKGACLVAFDKKTGKEGRRRLDDEASLPGDMIEQSGKPVLLCWTGDNVVGLDPKSGKTYWQHPFKPTRMVIAIATPVVDRNRAFVTSFYDGSLLLKLDQDKRGAVEGICAGLGPMKIIPTVCTRSSALPLCRAILSTASTAMASCAVSTPRREIASGKVSHGSQDSLGDHPFRAEWRPYLDVQRSGRIDHLPFESQGLRRNQPGQADRSTVGQLNRRDGVCWSHPAFANRHVFARNDDELVAASLAAEK